jgi:hypothetical protein
MKDLKRMLMIALMLGVTSIGAFAQEQKPPKPKPPDIEAGKKREPQPSNRGQEPKKGDDKKKP